MADKTLRVIVIEWNNREQQQQRGQQLRREENSFEIQ